MLRHHGRAKIVPVREQTALLHAQGQKSQQHQQEQRAENPWALAPSTLSSQGARPAREMVVP
jgi:hypothetical protein